MATKSGGANLRFLAFAVWSVGAAALLIGWDLSTVDRHGHPLPDKPLGDLFMRFLLLAVALAVGAFATIRYGDKVRMHLLIGTAGPIAWYLWRAQDARVSGTNFSFVGAVIIAPLVLGATWVGAQQGVLLGQRRRASEPTATDVASAAPAVRKPKTNALGVGALVLGMCTIGTVGSVLSMILGYVAVRQIDRSNGAQNGRDVAHGSMVLGLLGTFILCFGFFT